MAARDNVIFMGTVTNGSAAGTVIPCALLYGIENVRQGYGTPKLKNARAYYYGVYTNAGAANLGINIRIKNSNWIDSAGLVAQKFVLETSLNRDSLAFMRGRDKVLAPNTSWVIEAELPYAAAADGFVYVVLEIEYGDVPGFATEGMAGSPVVKQCKSASVTAAANTVTNLGTFDNLLQDVTYILSEVSATGLTGSGAFLILEGFSNQKGLIRIIPVRAMGLADQIEGSVYLTKQTYNVGIISSEALSAAPVGIQMELIASKN